MNKGRTLPELVAEVTHPGESFLVTLSGGADSVALLVALTSLGHRCRAIHCNYHLRGDESDRDEMHASDVARQCGVEIDIIQCDVSTYRSTHPGQSIEMACRSIRYEAFERLRAKHALDSIAIGHHLEDNVETMMLNMLRGTGIKGLAAMRPRRGVFVRPLLRCTKPLIVSYLQEKGIGYVTDSSNLSNDFRRNALRNDILPAIKKYFPDALTGMSHTLDALSNQRNILEITIDEEYERYCKADGTIELERLLNETHYPTDTLLFEILNRPDYRGYNLDTVANIIRSAGASGLKFGGTDDSSYLLDHGNLVPINEDINPHQEIAIDISNLQSWPSFIKADIITHDEFRPQRDPMTAYFDADELNNCKYIILRHPRPGDRLQPWGMKGSRLLSDIFTDRHYTHRQRNMSWVLEADGRILWLVGIRASRHATVTTKTGRILAVRQSCSHTRI